MVVSYSGEKAGRTVKELKDTNVLEDRRDVNSIFFIFKLIGRNWTSASSHCIMDIIVVPFSTLGSKSTSWVSSAMDWM